MRHRWMLSLALAAACCLAAPAARAAVKIGVVDVQRVIDDSEKGKQARDLLQKRFEREKAELEKKGKEIELFRQDLEKQALVLSPEKRSEKEDELRRRIKEFNRLKKDKQEEFNRKQMQVLREVMNSVMKVIRAYGKAHGFTVILDGTSGPVLYQADGVDITDEVIRAFNQSSGGK